MSYYLYEFRREFKRRTFEAKILWGTGKNESIVDMNQMTRVVEPYVSVVPVLDLNEVGNDTVCGATLHEISLSCQEFFGVCGAKFIVKVA